MITQVVLCPYCQGTDIVRHGTTPEGKQRYRCRACPDRGRTFLLEYAYAGQSPDIKRQIVDMAMNASGIRDTARVLHVSPTTVLRGRCFRAVDSMSEGSSKFIAIDEETDHEIVHGCGFGKANRAAYEPLDPGPQIDVFALDGLHVLFTDDVPLRDDMPLIRPPAIGVKARDPKRLEQLFELQKDRILPPPKEVRQHGPAGVIDGVPKPPWLCFLPDITPHLIEF